jgi:hypothetical protein
MTAVPVRYPHDRITTLENLLLSMREEQIVQAAHIAQLVAMRRLQVRCRTPHGPLVAQQLRTAEDAADDLIDRHWPVQTVAAVEEWPLVPSSILTNGGDL